MKYCYTTYHIGKSSFAFIKQNIQDINLEPFVVYVFQNTMTRTLVDWLINWLAIDCAVLM